MRAISVGWRDGQGLGYAHPARNVRAEMDNMQTHNETENKADYAKYETLGEPETILVGKQGFIEVAHKRATFKDGATRDFVLIARGYVGRDGRRRTQRLVTIPTEFAPRVAQVLAVGGAELRTAQQRLAESGEA